MDIRAICEAATLRITAGDFEGAASLLRNPIAASGRDPNLLYVAGNCALARGDVDEALVLYERSIAAAPRFVAALTNLGFVLRSRHRRFEAQGVLQRAVTLEPLSVAAWVNLVSCYVNEGDSVAGEAVAREAIGLHPSQPLLRWNLALLLLEQGKWREGWQEYGQRFDTPVVQPLARSAEVERLRHPSQLRPGDIVLCHGEQGLGDEILFAGMLGEFISEAKQANAEVVLAPCPRLAEIYRRSFDDGRRTARVFTGTEAAPDWCVPIGDLPRFYRNRAEDFPLHDGYLSFDSEAAAKYRTVLTGGRTSRHLVGIAWRGGSDYTHAVHRTIPLQHWLPILQQNATFVSLAYHDASNEITDLRDRYGIAMIELPDVTMASNYARTVELVASLDLVITVPTSVHHVAGAIGTPCWLVMDERAAWRECSHDHSIPWYPLTHRRVVRPRTTAGWDRTLAELATEFAAWLKERSG